MTLSEIWKQVSHTPHLQKEAAYLFDLSCLFEHSFGISRYRLPIVGEQTANPEQAAAFFALLERYSQGEPLQYLLGEWEFYGLPFAVGPGVLIPRADTEILVETALELLKERENPVVADLCAGSGCVGIAIADARKDAQVFALELSSQAFAYLCRNIQKNEVSVKPIQCDVRTPPELPMLDLVVANVPYICADEMKTLDIQVQHEPTLALYGGEDGYDFYRTLPALYAPLLKPNGAIAFETGYQQARTVCEMLSHAGYLHPQIRCDLCGIERVAFAYK